MLIDAHCHLNELTPEELTQVLDRAATNGVGRLIAVGAGYGYDANRQTLAIAQKYPQVYCTLGMHPHDARLVTDEMFQELEDLAKNERVRAVGEIGLDYHYMHSPRDEQRSVLRRFIQLALRLNKPIVIHDRDCADECVEILTEEGAPKVGGMVHCFTGSAELAQKYLDIGFIVSFTGIITFKKSEALREVVKMVPLSRMTIETDSPFLAPLPFRGKKNEPAYVKHVAECVAQVKGVSVDEVARVTTENATRLFKLPSP